MRNGIYIRAGVVRLVVIAAIALVGAVIAHEFPTMRRYLKIERM